MPDHEHAPDAKHDEDTAHDYYEEQAAVARHESRADVNFDVSLAPLQQLVGNVTSLLSMGVPVADMAEYTGDMLAHAAPATADALTKMFQTAHKAK